MIENEHQLERAYRLIARMIVARDNALQEQHWHESLRQSVAEGVEVQRREIEREIADYLAVKMLSPEEPAKVAVG